MHNELKKEIKRLCKKAFDKSNSIVIKEEKHREKFSRRTGLTAGVAKHKKKMLLHKHFDPLHCMKNANGIASAIWHKVLELKYDPEPAILFAIPKADGSKREITAFGIPDAALANVVFRRTQKRNSKRFSPHSYAYRPDKNVFDAILALRDFDRDGKLFVVQVDFKKYFDNIPSNYLKKKMSDRGTVSITPHEKHIFEKFLHHRYCESRSYSQGKFRRKVKGTPQGSSTSLILANLANHDLDRRLSAEPGKFVRFADDVVAICGKYEEALSLEKCFDRHCAESGLIINQEKSPGISILSSFINEIRTTHDFTYLGYGFRESGLCMPKKTVQKLKQKISRLINIYLINSLKIGFDPIRANRSEKFDWDLFGLICEIRRGFYGGLREQEIENFIYGKSKLSKMQGLMGFYCLIENADSLRELDGWTVNMVRRACVERNRILISKYSLESPTPTNKELILGTWIDPHKWRKGSSMDDIPEMGFPSLMRGWRAARKHFFTFGLEGVQSPGYNSSFDVSSLFESLKY